MLQWDEDTLETMREQVTEPKVTLQAVKELKRVKSTAKQWMVTSRAPHKPLPSNNADNSSLASSRSLAPIEEMSEQLMKEESADDDQEQEKDQNSDDESSFRTADTPLKQIVTMV